MRRLELDELLNSAKELKGARELLAGGGLLAVPTETHYGFAVSPFDDRAVERIFQVKGRDDGKDRKSTRLNSSH